MKKTLIVAILTVLMIFPVVACGNGDDTNSEIVVSQSSAVKSTEIPTEENTQEPTQAPTEAFTEAETYAPTEVSTEISTEEITENPSDNATTSPTQVENPITVTSYTNSVSPGAYAFVEMQGLPNTEYNITVYYSSGESETEGLENKVSDENGYIRWEWKVGAKTKAGTYSIIISGNNQKTETQFTVTE